MAVLPEDKFYAFSRILDYILLSRDGSKMLKRLSTYRPLSVHEQAKKTRFHRAGREYPCSINYTTPQG